ncbi:DNA polymerase II small subunit [uncultured archaeon]|nr:DNA polymerase II small subunit [uncultured archaeon]
MVQTLEEVLDARQESINLKKIDDFKIKNCNIEGNTGELKEFVQYFKDRLLKLRKIIQGNLFQQGLITVQNSKEFLDRREVVIAGLVNSKSTTKNGNIRIELEDETSKITCIVSKDSEAFKKTDELVEDEVIGLRGGISNSLFIVKEIIYPEVPMRTWQALQDEDEYVAFLSDLHFGSKYCLKNKLKTAIEFLNGNIQEEIGKKIKTVLICGDVVDGIGIFPEQEKELEEKNIYNQFKEFEDFVLQINEDKRIVIIPGNHDPVRLAEPQPTIPVKFLPNLANRKNVVMGTNPCTVEIKGKKILMYHGRSLFSISTQIPKIQEPFKNPDKIAEIWLRKRHLNPIYGFNPIVPEPEDELVIKDLPDVIHFGDIHHNAASVYRGIRIINSGTFQDTTELQKKGGLVPTPGIIPILNLKNGSIKQVIV